MKKTKKRHITNDPFVLRSRMSDVPPPLPPRDCPPPLPSKDCPPPLPSERKKRIWKIVWKSLLGIIVLLLLLFSYFYPGPYRPYSEQKEECINAFMFDTTSIITTPCPVCETRGYQVYHFFGLIKERCTLCKGTGWLPMDVYEEYQRKQGFPPLRHYFSSDKEEKEESQPAEERVETLGEGVFPKDHTYYYVSFNGLAASVRYYVDKQNDCCIEIRGIDNVQYDGTYYWIGLDKDNWNSYKAFIGYQDKFTGYHYEQGQMVIEREEVKGNAYIRCDAKITNDYRRLQIHNSNGLICILEIVPKHRFDEVEAAFQAKRKAGELPPDVIVGVNAGNGGSAASSSSSAYPSGSSSSEYESSSSSAPSHRRCPDCGGSGTCRMCKGKGYKKVIGPSTDVDDPKEVFQDCEWCHGSGRCGTCRGVGHM